MICIYRNFAHSKLPPPPAAPVPLLAPLAPPTGRAAGARGAPQPDRGATRHMGRILLMALFCGVLRVAPCRALRGSARQHLGRALGRGPLPAFPRQLLSQRKRQPAAAARGGPGDLSVKKEVFKKKCALVIGYSGSAYHGNQATFNEDAVAVEDVLLAALHGAGFVSDANRDDPSHIAWSRSSRTDKGVHALRLLVSAKLLVRDAQLCADGSMPEIVAALNARLPEDVRVWSCTGATKSFSARSNCIWREYVYVLPLACLALDGEDLVAGGDGGADGGGPLLTPEGERVVGRLDGALREFNGVHCFHHFTPWRTFNDKNAARRQKAIRANSNRYADGGDAAEAEDAELLADPLLRYFNERAMDKKLYSAMYHCELVGGAYFAADGTTPLLKVRFKGQRFVYNQIRMMVGAAMCVASGALPAESIYCALHGTKAPAMPLAPAEGLMLHCSGYDSFRSPSFMTAQLLREADEEQSGAGTAAGGTLLMRDDEWRASEAFAARAVEPQVERSWFQEQSISAAGAQFLFPGRFDDRSPTDRVALTPLEVWRATLRASADALPSGSPQAQRLAQLFAEAKDRAAEEIAAGHDRTLKRRRRALERYCAQEEAWSAYEDAFRRGAPVAAAPQIDDVLRRENRVKALTPSGFAAALVTRFRAQPGPACTNVSRAVAQRFMDGAIAADAGAEELLELVEREGFSQMVREGQEAFDADEAEKARRFDVRRAAKRAFKKRQAEDALPVDGDSP